MPAHAEDNRLEDQSVNVVFATLAYHHFSERQKAISEMICVAKSGPVVIFSRAARCLPAFRLCDYFPGLFPGPKDRIDAVESAARDITTWTVDPRNNGIPIAQ